MTEDKNAKQKWTEQDDEQLRDFLLKAGLSYAETGKKLGRNKNQIIGRAHRLGIAKLRTAASTQPDGFKRAAGVKRPPKKEALPSVLRAPSVIQRGGCQWIDGHPVRGQPVLFCEKAATDGMGPWCDEHRARVYVSGADRKAALKSIAFVGGKSGVGTETWGAAV